MAGRGGSRRRAAWVAFVATWVASSAARADASSPATSSLAWLRLPGSETCVAAQDLARAVEARLGREVFVPTSRADLSIEARVEPLPAADGGGHRATILVRDAGGETLGERTIEDKDPTCAALTEPLALVIALLIDPDALSREPAAPAPTPPAAPSVPAGGGTVAGDAPPRAEPPRRDPLRFEGTLVSAFETGLTPGLAYGFGGSALLQLPRVPVSLRGEAVLFVPVEATRAGVDAAFDLGLVSGYVCPTAVVSPRVRLLACLGSQAGLVRARARAPFLSEDDLRPMWNVAAEARAGVQLVGPLVLTAGVGAAVGIFRKDLRLDRAPGDRVVVHEMAPVSFLGEVGLGVIVP